MQYKESFFFFFLERSEKASYILREISYKYPEISYAFLFIP